MQEKSINSVDNIELKVSERNYSPLNYQFDDEGILVDLTRESLSEKRARLIKSIEEKALLLPDGPI